MRYIAGDAIIEIVISQQTLVRVKIIDTIQCSVPRKYARQYQWSFCYLS